MMQNKQRLVARISSRENLRGSLNQAIVKEYPELENLEVIPSKEEQVFMSDKYGYDTVKVNAIEGENLTITPTKADQTIEGVFTSVTVKAIETDDDAMDEELMASVISTMDSSSGRNVTKLPSKLTSIGNYAFYYCIYLGLTELPSGVTSIGQHAFYNCSELTLKKLPDGVSVIGRYAFSGCSNLALTELPSGITSIANYTFQKCKKLALEKLPDGITRIEQYAFSYCSELPLTELPSSLTFIGTRAFEDCSNISIKEIPSGITIIDSYTFYSCDKITSLKILGDITAINDRAFYASGLTELILPNVTSVPTISTYTIHATPIAQGKGYVYVPDELVESFKTATNWSVYSNQIKGLSELA